MHLRDSEVAVDTRMVELSAWFLVQYTLPGPVEAAHFRVRQPTSLKTDCNEHARTRTQSYSQSHLLGLAVIAIQGPL